SRSPSCDGRCSKSTARRSEPSCSAPSNAARSPAPPCPSGSPHSRSNSSGASSSCDSIACPTRRSSTSWTRRSCPSPPCRGRTERLTPSGRPRSSTARPRRLRDPTLTTPPSRPRFHDPAFTTSPIRTDARFAPFSIRCPYPWWMDLTASLVGALPKAALHDHLDGGLRAETVLELSQALGLEVPGLEAPLDEAPDAEVASGGAPPGDVTADTPAAGAPTPDGPAADATTAEVPPADAARAVADWF